MSGGRGRGVGRGGRAVGFYNSNNVKPGVISVSRLDTSLRQWGGGGGGGGEALED